MQQQNSYNSSEAARVLGLNNTTIQRAIQRGDLNGTRPRDRAPYIIERDELLRFAIANGHKLHADTGELIDPSTGEVLEQLPEAPTPIVAATAARARLAGVAPVELAESIEVATTPQFGAADYTRRPLESNVSRVLLPSTEVGLLEACRRLVALPESPQLWEALRAVLGVEAPA
jgi:excisionase family DNA binding protein